MQTQVRCSIQTKLGNSGEPVSTIDRQLVEAVHIREEMGYVYRFGRGYRFRPIRHQLELFVAYEIEVRACAWRDHFGLSDTRVIDLSRILEIRLPTCLRSVSARRTRNCLDWKRAGSAYLRP